MSNRLETVVAVILGLGALTFALLLAGFGSGALTEDPPAVSPYATGGTTTTSVAEAEPPSADITISGFAFSDPITVVAGTEVTVTNEDGAGHTWTSNDGLWDSGTLRGGDTFSFTFDAPGEYSFFCAIHPSMTGNLTVTG